MINWWQILLPVIVSFFVTRATLWYDSNKQKRKSVKALILIVYSYLEALYITFSESLEERSFIKEGKKYIPFLVIFNTRIASIQLTESQLEKLMEIFPNKRVVSCLITMKSFVDITTYSCDPKTGNWSLPNDKVLNLSQQLFIQLHYIKDFYESKFDSFPLEDYIGNNSPQERYKEYIKLTESPRVDK